MFIHDRKHFYRNENLPDKRLALNIISSSEDRRDQFLLFLFRHRRNLSSHSTKTWSTSSRTFERSSVESSKKRGKSNELFDQTTFSFSCFISQLFETVRSINPKFEEKVFAMPGDILDPNFGLSFDDERKLIEECNIVFHSAATVRFQEPMRWVETFLRETPFLSATIELSFFHQTNAPVKLDFRSSNSQSIN